MTQVIEGRKFWQRTCILKMKRNSHFPFPEEIIQHKHKEVGSYANKFVCVHVFVYSCVLCIFVCASVFLHVYLCGCMSICMYVFVHMSACVFVYVCLFWFQRRESGPMSRKFQRRRHIAVKTGPAASQFILTLSMLREILENVARIYMSTLSTL